MGLLQVAAIMRDFTFNILVVTDADEVHEIFMNH